MKKALISSCFILIMPSASAALGQDLWSDFVEISKNKIPEELKFDIADPGKSENVTPAPAEPQLKYEEISRYISKYPLSKEARSKRYKIAQSLRPEGRSLEQMINDALLADLPIDHGPGAEYSEATKNNIVYHINRLKQVIYRWPYFSDSWMTVNPSKTSVDLWTAIISWNKIANIKNLIYKMVNEINYFDEFNIWHAKLPTVVHLEIINELSSENRAAELHDWLMATRSGLEELKIKELNYDSELLEITIKLLSHRRDR